MAIREQPHYEIAPSELAAWTERHGINTWWAVDGDVYLSSRVPTPCRGDELAAVLRRANRPLLVATHEPQANGQVIGPEKLDELAEPLDVSTCPIQPTHPRPKWADDRCLWLCWKDQTMANGCWHEDSGKQPQHSRTSKVRAQATHKMPPIDPSEAIRNMLGNVRPLPPDHC